MKSRRFSLSDIVVFLFCAAGLALCLFLFWEDLYASFSRNEEPVGTISFRHNTAQRRFIDRVLWDRLRNKSPVYEGDVIRTANLSEATVTFTDGGGTVDVAENTLIQISANAVDFMEGGISAAAAPGSSLVITSAGKSLSLDPGSALSAAAYKDGGLDVALSAGSAALADGQSPGRAIEAGNSLLFNAAGEAQTLPRAAAVSPPSGARFLSAADGSLSVNFGWNTANYPPEGRTRFEIAADRGFKRTRFSEDLSGGRFDASLPEGVFFWRVYPAAGEKPAEIPYAKITIVRGAAPVLLSPAAGAVFGFRGKLPSPRFVWTTSPEAASYLLEAADNPALANPALSLSVAAGAGDDVSVLAPAPGEGNWYWRVTPVYGRNFSGTPAASQTGTFRVERGAELSPPVLIAPADAAFLNIEEGGRDIIFSWKKENDAASYTLRVSPDSGMASPLIEQTLTGTWYRLGAAENALPPGAWYWTVTQTAADGEVSPAAAPRSFTAARGELIQQAAFPPEGYTVQEDLLPGISFSWKTNLPGTRFQIARGEDFSPPLFDEAAAAESRTGISLQSGVYFWRLTGGGPDITRASPPRRFVVAPPLAAPELNAPEGPAVSSRGGETFIRQGGPAAFSWQPAAGAEYYAFRLYPKDNPAPVLEQLADSPRLDLATDALTAGAYTWTVQGMARETPSSSPRTSAAAARDFTLERSAAPVVLESPKNGWEYGGIEASRRPAAVLWSSRERAEGTRFILARDARMTDIVHSQANPPRRVLLPGLSAGDYYWTIRARTPEGIDISAPAPAGFRVLPAPRLPVPQNRLPAEGYTAGLAQIQASRSIAFSWNPVPGANAYILTIFRGSGPGRKTALTTPALKETRHTLEDLRPLGRGDFFWQVEAVYIRDDGVTDQRGLLAENKFTIDIPLPPRIQTKESGVLYGN